MSIAPTREHILPDMLTASDLLAVAPMSMRVEDGHVTLGGIDLIDIAEKFGTALYVYDEAHIRRQLSEYREEFKLCYPQSSIIYAAKAFCCVAMDRIVADESCYIDVASGGELAIARAAGFPMEHVVAQGNNKTPREIAEAIESGVGLFVVDTIEELDRISACAKANGVEQTIVLRICPGIEADTHAYIQTANEDSKFGFNIRNGAAQEALKHALGLPNLDVAGFHCHIGSQIFELNSYVEAINTMFAFMDEMRHVVGFTARILDIGGGLGIPYTVHDEPASIAQFAKTATDAVHENCSTYDYPYPHLFTEPGRSIVANAGITLYTVGSVKVNEGICTYVAIDGGMTDNIRTALYGSKYEAFVVDHADEPRSVICDIVGKHCESGDVVVKNSPLQPCRAGDTVCVLGTGAYCNEMASNYNKQVRPGIVFVTDGVAHEVVRRETYSDLLMRDVL
ncbi:MAG: diaminopimelate decarboxylase [Coriobacteriales bacterium]|jgi:diaminopimelate decarboxylase